MPRSPLGHRAPLGWILLPFIGGLILAKLSPIELPALGLLATAAVGLIVAGATRDRARVWAIHFCGSIVLAGAAYYEVRRARLPDWNDLPPREAHLTVQLTRIFAANERPESLSALARVREADFHLQDLVGQPVAVSVRLPPDSTRPIRGSLLHVKGVLEPLPRRAAEEGFRGYLVDTGVNFQLRRGGLMREPEAPGTYARWREKIRVRASQSLGRGLDRHPALSAALRGMLLGERNGLTDAQQNLFLRSGAMHFFAISGLHIGVIAGGIIGLLRLARVPRVATLIIGSCALAFYVDITGALPSAVRAWLMVVCFHAALVLRAPGNPVAALVASALLVLLFDPMQLFGIGFQMSYAIMVALLLYGLPLEAHWAAAGPLWQHLPVVSQSWWHRRSAAAWQWIQSAMAVTLAAGLVGILSGVAFFGYLVPVSVIGNLVLLPVATAAILIGFASVVCGLIGIGWMAIGFNHVAALLVLAMQGILEALTSVPASSTPAHLRMTWLGHGGLLFTVALVTWGYLHRWERPPSRYWAPWLAVGALLAVGLQFD
jgi:competence protein ComEC